MMFFFPRDNIDGWYALDKWLTKNKYKKLVYTDEANKVGGNYTVMIEFREGVDFQPVIDYAGRCGVKLVA